MKRRVYGEISLEDYQRVLDEMKRRKQRVEGNCTEREVEDPVPKSSLWERVRNMPKIVLILLVFPIFYSAGATWRWDGKWSRELSMERLTLVSEDPTYPEDRTRMAVVRISRKIGNGLETLGTVARRSDQAGSTALEELEHWTERAQKILEDIRDK